MTETSDRVTFSIAKPVQRSKFHLWVEGGVFLIRENRENREGGKIENSFNLREGKTEGEFVSPVRH